MNDKEKIIERFKNNVLGKRPTTQSYNIDHDGKGGHWLEHAMGLSPNRSNSPDIFGYEMKNQTTSKTTFGDWSADYYVFKNNSFSRDNFLRAFGKSNAAKDGRYSWSGEPVPKIGNSNRFGQWLKVDNQSNIFAMYSYSKDTRKDKNSAVPARFQIDDLILARWDNDSLKSKLEKKFNQKGWFKCNMDVRGVYSSIAFGDPINFNNWIKFVKSGDVFFDSGMFQGNARNYSQWRASNSFWAKLILTEYP